MAEVILYVAFCPWLLIVSIIWKYDPYTRELLLRHYHIINPTHMPVAKSQAGNEHGLMICFSGVSRGEEGPI